MKILNDAALEEIVGGSVISKDPVTGQITQDLSFLIGTNADRGVDKGVFNNTDGEAVYVFPIPPGQAK